MRRLKQGSITVFTTLALGLVLALPAAAQTAEAASFVQSYTVQTAFTSQAGRESPDSPMVFTVVQKPGADSEGVVITWKGDPQAKEGLKENGRDNLKVKYEVETTRQKGVSAE